MATFAQIKAQNAKEEAAAAAAAKPPQDDDTLTGADTVAGNDTVAGDDTVDGADDTLTGDDTQAGGDEDTVDGGDDTQPGAAADDADDWMKGDDGKPAATPKFTDGDAAKQRRKYQGKLIEKETEIEKLKREKLELEARLKEGKTTAPAAVSTKPSRDAFDSEDAYQEALTVWAVEDRLNRERAADAAAAAKRQRDEHAAETEAAVEEHYTRAMDLVEQTKSLPPERRVTAELFQAADRSLREAVDGVFPKGGDVITDQLLANLGPGSEKVAYNLGVNKARRDEFVALLKKDPSGIKAAVYLGKLNEKLNATRAVQTRTPEPPEDVRGDRKAPVAEDKLKKQWEAAHSRGDVQGAMAIRRKAESQKVDTRAWLK